MEKKKSNSKNTSTSTKKKSTTTGTKTSSAAVKSSKVSSAKKSTVDLKKVREEEKPKVDLIKVENTKKSNSIKSMNDIKNFGKIKYYLYALGIILIALGVLFNNTFIDKEVFGFVLGDYVIPVKLLGALVLGATGVTGAVLSEKNSLIKSLLVVVGVAILGAWILPNGSLSGSTFVDAGTYGLSINDLVSLAYNGVYMCIDKILVLIFICLFYKIAEATGAYHKIIDKITNKNSCNLDNSILTKIFLVCSSLGVIVQLVRTLNMSLLVVAVCWVILIYTIYGIKDVKRKYATAIAAIVIALISFITEIYAVLFFLPFFVSILSKLKVDKVTTMAVTFGALMAGAIGSPYGTEALSGFNYYASLSIENAFMYRVILQLCVVALFTLFVSLRLKEKNYESKEEAELDATEELFLTEKEYGKINETPLIILMIITALFFTVGFIDWAGNFDILIFEEFHTWLFELSIGDYMIFELLLGDSASIIGAFSVFDGITVLIVMITLMVLSYRVKIDELIKAFASTMKFLVKPLIVIVLITVVFTVGYMTQFMASAGQYILDLTPEFNPYTSSIVAAISGIFHNDLAFTGYVFSAFFAERYTVYADALSLSFTSISALVQLIIPTSPLLIGLFYTNVSYKTWIKYIAIFFAGILLIVLILLTVVTYLG